MGGFSTGGGGSASFPTGLTWDSTDQALSITSIANPAASSLNIVGGTALTTNQPAINVTQGWNNAAQNFNGINLNVSGTAYLGGSALLNLALNGSSVFSVAPSGNVSAAGNILSSGGNLASTNALVLGGGQAYLYSDGSGIFGQRQTINAQALRVYNTWTNASNYEAAVFDWQTTANTLTIGSVAAGTGTLRSLLFQGAGYTWNVSGSSRLLLSSTYLSASSAGALSLGASTSYGWKQLFIDATISATVGSQTINKAAGSFQVAAAATSVTITNSLVSANSLVFPFVASNDATAAVRNVVAAAGSFTVNLVAPTAQTTINFWVLNN